LTIERSHNTQERAKKAPISLVLTDIDLVSESDYILSIVPPKDALSTAERIVTALKEKPRDSDLSPMYYLDLNAIAPSSAKAIGARLSTLGGTVRLIDGGIIGGPPKTGTDVSQSKDDFKHWSRPSIVLSGPYKLSEAPRDGLHLAEVLRTKHVGADIGTASGLKCCYASLTKGFTALAIQSYSTAARLGVLEHLREEIRGSNPASETRAVRGLTGMPPKAGRWVKEMQEIGKAFREEGGWQGAPQAEGEEAAGSIFEEIAEVYRYVAEDTVLGEEHSMHRVRGTTAEDTVAAILESRG
jgi:3-hydroxyisobutyrate dehydrogenase-like beta-hydroxyacid dehydrogenase